MSKEYREPSKENNKSSEIEQSDEQEEKVKAPTTQEVQEKPVMIKAEAYKTIILYANRYANNAIPSSEWKEIYGVLIGYSNEDFVYINRAEALTYGHSTDVKLDEKHYIFIDSIEQELLANGSNNYIIGWFHSHPGLNLFFSYVDIINQLGFQNNNEDAIGLVYDHTLLGKKRKEKIVDQDGKEQEITKYDTGFEIYRITDITMSENDPSFDTNYHEVEYFMEGLNKYFFANVMAELSELVSAGKPLQSAYGESLNQKSTETMESTTRKKDNDIPYNLLEEIPLDEEIVFINESINSRNAQPYQLENERMIEQAERFVNDGMKAFKNKDSITGVELYNKGIDIYESLNNFNKVLELLRDLVQYCINNKHFILAEEFSDKLLDLAEQQGNLFYLGEGNYYIGYILLKRGDNERLEFALKSIEKAAIDFETDKDYAFAGLCFEKIGMIYLNRLNMTENACLFFREAIQNYNKGILRGHSMRTSLWGKPEMLIQKIKELRDVMEDLVPKIKNSPLKDKILQDMKSIHYNF